MAQRVRCSCGTTVDGITVESVTFIVCPRCDRKKCKECGTVDMTGTAMRCPNGHAVSIHDG